jgi:CCR4-NOT transcription complex subunit 1
VRLFQHSPNAEKSFIDFVTQLQTQGILKGEEISSMFFRVCTEVSVDSYIKQKAVGGSVATGIFAPCDAFSKLVVLMIKYHADPNGTNKEQAKVHYLTKILSIIVLVLAQSHEELGAHFQQKPFFRIFSSLLHDLSLAEASLQTAYYHSLAAISNTLNTLQPAFFPGFTFSWMSLLSHRVLLPHLLGPSNRSGWASFHRLITSLLRFMAPFLRSVELRETSRSVYRGAVRIFLILLHDFPEFLAAYSHSLCDLVPTSAIQLRNIVLCAYPRKLRLPNPFDKHLQISSMAEAKILPDFVPEQLQALDAVFGMKDNIELCLQEPADVPDMAAQIHTAVCDLALSRPGQQETRFRVPLLNAVVTHIGFTAIEHRGNTGNDHGKGLLKGLLHEFNTEGEHHESA